VEKEVGNGYFNAVFLDVVTESNLDRYPEISEVLRFTYHDQVEPSRSYVRCREAISLAISARAKELTEALGYSAEEAKQILIKAIARYVDERFSVTGRRVSGLL
jgi:hypothetical protein